MVHIIDLSLPLSHHFRFISSPPIQLRNKLNICNIDSRYVHIYLIHLDIERLSVIPTYSNAFMSVILHVTNFQSWLHPCSAYHRMSIYPMLMINRIQCFQHLPFYPCNIVWGLTNHKRISLDAFISSCDDRSFRAVEIQ